MYIWRETENLGLRSPNEIKRSFVLKSAVWFGLGLGVAPILFCGKFDDIGFMFFTLVSSVCVGLLWGLIMWQDISSNNPRLQDITADHQKASDQAADVTHFVFDARYDEYGVGQAERSRRRGVVPMPWRPCGHPRARP